MYSFIVQIYDDEEPELPEEFYIDLRIAPEAESRGVRLALPDTATVVIKDDDSECCSNMQTLHTVHIESNITCLKLARAQRQTKWPTA